jgi:hypothetical protein
VAKHVINGLVYLFVMTSFSVSSTYSHFQKMKLAAASSATGFYESSFLKMIFFQSLRRPAP